MNWCWSVGQNPQPDWGLKTETDEERMQTDITLFTKRQTFIIIQYPVSLLNMSQYECKVGCECCFMLQLCSCALNSCMFCVTHFIKQKIINQLMLRMFHTYGQTSCYVTIGIASVERNVFRGVQQKSWILLWREEWAE